MAKYLTELERCRIETMLKDGLSQREIARRLNRHYNTINYEIKKGRIEFLNTDLTTRTEYCFDAGQRIHEERCREKGRPLKISNDMAFVRFVERKIRDEKYSPYATLQTAKGHFKTDVCVSTLYSYIDKGIFLNISNKDLPQKPKKKHGYKALRRTSLKHLGAKSIEERPKEADGRKVYGHWEMDTVIGKNKKYDGCLLVLTERATREEIIMRMDEKSSACVVDALDTLERAYGADGFRRTFLTITPDNGCEFSDFEGMEKNGRTKVYFAHPYAPHERGSNENQNKLIRRFSPKGESMKDLTPEDARYIQEWLNNYPRKLLGGLTPLEYRKILS